MSRLQQLGRKVGLGLIWFYQCCISPLKPGCCRFQPTCSAYARDAIVRFGLLRGAWLAARRLLRCHPFYHGCLYDPVPPKPESAEKRVSD